MGRSAGRDPAPGPEVLLRGDATSSVSLARTQAQTYRGHFSSVWNRLNQHRGHTKRAQIFLSAKLSIRTSPQHTTRLILKDPLSAKAYLKKLYRASSEIATLAHLGGEFFRLVRSHDLATWSQWLEHAKHTVLRGFASSLLHDQHAAEAALTLPRSNGPVEGHVHSLKLIKRQMYGRASFDLVRTPCSPSGLISRYSERERKGCPPLPQMCARAQIILKVTP
jgi:transposase